MLLPFFEWCEQLWLGQFIIGSNWLFPVIESVHLLGLSVLGGAILVVDMRLLGLALTRVPVTDIATRLLPWTKAGFTVMVITGVLLFYAIPVRTYQSVFFRAKVVMLILAGLNVWIFNNRVFLRVAEWDRDARTPRAARRAALFSLILWGGIIVAGRMIAYNWFDCDIQPQPAIVNFVAGCVVPPAAP